MTDDPMGDSERLVSNLFDRLCAEQAGQDCERMETHISWILLVDGYAYKIKKPLDLGFLDFSTLEKRHFFCEEELRLNRRLAPAIYLAVQPITGKPDQPQLAGDGEPIEYAVQMRRFPQAARLDQLLAQHQLTPERIDALATFCADFHATAATAGDDSPYGTPEAVIAPARENFTQIQERLDDADSQGRLQGLSDWTEQTYASLQPRLNRRRQAGFIRECHGDLHLGNLAWYPDAPLAFDCLEFNPALRWIDVISEAAFLVMDLQSRGEPALAQRFLNRYLERGGDYAGLHLLRFFLLYRALVRAKVSLITHAQHHGTHADEKEFLRYLDLAESYTLPPKPHLLITFGPSASGKSTLTQPLLEVLGAIRIRSDVERKRLCGIGEQQHATAATGAGIYDPAITDRTYERLLAIAAELLAAGYPVIVDATFAAREHRQRFRELADELGIPFHILDFQTPPALLRQRIIARQADMSDANLAVLEHQLAHWRPLDADEEPVRLVIDTTQTINTLHILEGLGLELL